MTTIRETQASGAAAGLATLSSAGATDAAAWQEELRAAMQGSATASGDKTAIMGSLGSSAGAAVAAQAIGRETEAAAAEPSAKDQFLEFMEMTPMERMRAQILKSLGVTEEQLAAMSPEERRKIEDKIRKIIEETVKREAAEKAAENTQTDDAAATATGDDAKAETNAAGPTLEQILPFLRDDGGQPIGGKEAKLTAAEKTRKD